MSKIIKLSVVAVYFSCAAIINPRLLPDLKVTLDVAAFEEKDDSESIKMSRDDLFRGAHNLLDAVSKLIKSQLL